MKRYTPEMFEDRDGGFITIEDHLEDKAQAVASILAQRDRLAELLRSVYEEWDEDMDGSPTIKTMFAVRDALVEIDKEKQS